MIPEHDRRIEQLLADAQAATGPTAWSRVEALLGAVVELYGESLRRLLDHARAGAGFDERIAGDEVVASVLLLHDLHPVPLEARLARALSALHAELPGHPTLEVESIADGTLTLRAPGKAPDLRLVAVAIEREAPELTGVRFASAKPSALVPVERLRRKEPR